MGSELVNGSAFAFQKGFCSLDLAKLLESHRLTPPSNPAEEVSRTDSAAMNWRRCLAVANSRIILCSRGWETDSAEKRAVTGYSITEV